MHRLIGLLAVLVVMVSSALAVELQVVGDVRGEDDGPTIIAVLPAERHPQTVGAARQLAAISLTKGRVVVLEYAGAATREELLGGVPFEYLLPPAHVVVVTQSLETNSPNDLKRLPELSTSDPRLAISALGHAVVGSFGNISLEPPEAELEEPIEGVALTHLDFAASETPRSRQARWTRMFVVVLAERLEMGPITERATANSVRAPLSFALYDCEGVGGSGPAMVERIVSGFGESASVSFVSGEDIREGALTGFNGVLFPGGSGRGIAEGIEESGQELVRAFVREGGGYVGICAGAYLATCRIDGYLEMAGLYHGQPWRKGGGMVEVELTEAGRAILGEEYASFSTRYNNGPIFGHEEGLTPEGEFEPAVTLATFKSAVNNADGNPSTEMVGADAITATTYGKGRVLLVSPHPETHSHLDPMMHRGLLWSVGREARAAE